ncbi:hypothetical protein D3C73_1501980 [compost metagenome]
MNLRNFQASGEFAAFALMPMIPFRPMLATTPGCSAWLGMVTALYSTGVKPLKLAAFLLALSIRLSSP